MSFFSLREQIREGIRGHSFVAGSDELQLSEQQLNLLARFVELLSKWNGAYNLTSVRDTSAMVSRHILDSLSIASFAVGQRLMDLGSGPGLPGVPVAILNPQREFVLIDGNGKKTRFLTQVKSDLALDNISVVNCRIESYRDTPFDAIMSRAFGALSDMVRSTSHLIAPSGVYLAMKGKYPTLELDELEKDGYATLRSCTRLNIPGCQVERHLVELEPCFNPAA